MNPKSIEQARDPDLRKSLVALKRAAKRAREAALRTKTRLVIARDGKWVRVSPPRSSHNSEPSESPGQRHCGPPESEAAAAALAGVASSLRVAPLAQMRRFAPGETVLRAARLAGGLARDNFLHKLWGWG
ncbi:MAG: hypothetical protein ACREV1_18505 [Gammaproteobacteria bacterium]